MLMCYAIVAGAWHWNRFNVPKISVVLAIVYAVILLLFIILQVFISTGTNLAVLNTLR